jgi:hypothetical protein
MEVGGVFWQAMDSSIPLATGPHAVATPVSMAACRVGPEAVAQFCGRPRKSMQTVHSSRARPAVMTKNSVASAAMTATV